MAVLAAALQNRRDVLGERHLGTGGRLLCTADGRPERCRAKQREPERRDSRENPLGRHQCSFVCYGVTVTVTSSSVYNAPSSARPRSTYVPGCTNVTCEVHLLSGGRAGGCHRGAHGEFPPARVSSQVFTCGGS